MNVMDPFCHHPSLRNEIVDPLQSRMRTFSPATLAAKAKELGLPQDWWYRDAVREELRARSLANHTGGDLWVFAYGSLMWDPGFCFAEVRRAHVAGHARRFILKDVYGGRGSLEAPGLMAALDKGRGCDGLLFRIAEKHIDQETEVLWRREQIGPAYEAAFVEATFDDGSVRALTFVADYSADLIDPDLTRADQVRYLATGTGFMGSSLDYLKNIEKKFAALGIQDDDVIALLNETRTYIDSLR